MASAREGPQPESLRIARPAGYADPVMWLTVAAAFAAYTAISVSRYVRRDPASWDLGIFTEVVKQYAHLHAPVVAIRGARFDLLGDHFHPALVVIAPLFRLFPSPVTLLVAQAAACAVSVIPITRTGIGLLGVAPGRLIGAAYGFSWGLASLNWYDFHEVALAVPLLAFAASALARRAPVAAAMWSVPLVFVKEDQGFTVAALGLVMLFVHRPAPSRLKIAGLLLAAWGLASSLIAIYVIIPHFNVLHHYPYWEKGSPLSGVTAHLASGAAVKLPTLILIFLPTAFLALRSPVVFVAVPGLLLRFVSGDTSYWGTGWHYNATIMPVVFAAAIDGLARIRAAHADLAHPPGQRARPGQSSQAGQPARPGQSSQAGQPARPDPARRPARSPGWRWVPSFGAAMERHGPAMMAIVAIALAFQFPLQNLWNPQSYQVSPHIKVVNAAIARVPPGATVEASLDELAPLAARNDTYWVGNPIPAPQWILFDQRSPEWSISNVPAFEGSRHPGAAYQTVFSDDGVWLLRRLGNGPR